MRKLLTLLVHRNQKKASGIISNEQTETVTSTPHRALLIVEILEHILVNLDIDDILKAKRLSKFVHEVITKSNILQRKCWLIPPTVDKTENALPVLHALLADNKNVSMEITELVCKQCRTFECRVVIIRSDEVLKGKGIPTAWKCMPAIDRLSPESDLLLGTQADMTPIKFLMAGSKRFGAVRAKQLTLYDFFDHLQSFVARKGEGGLLKKWARKFRKSRVKPSGASQRLHVVIMWVESDGENGKRPARIEVLRSVDRQ